MEEILNRTFCAQTPIPPGKEIQIDGVKFKLKDLPAKVDHINLPGGGKLVGDFTVSVKDPPALCHHGAGCLCKIPIPFQAHGHWNAPAEIPGMFKLAKGEPILPPQEFSAPVNGEIHCKGSNRRMEINVTAKTRGPLEPGDAAALAAHLKKMAREILEADATSRTNLQNLGPNYRKKVNP